jgi:hypothetical protein
LIPILIVLSVAFLIAAILAVVFLTVLAVTGAVVGFILHKLGYDRRLLIYVMHKGRTSRHYKVPVDDLDVPITTTWRLEDQRPA